jgi:signal peptidase I
VSDAPHPPVAPGEADGVARRLEREPAADAGRPSAPVPPAAPVHSSTRNALEWVAVVAGAIVIAVVIRTFFLQTFWIPSPSMAPTLVKDDRVLVNKLSYRFGDPSRGDVIVFERPPNEPPSGIKDLIKRVVALPGERISIVEGTVRIDGRLLEEPYVDGAPTLYDGGCTQPGVDLTGLDTEQGYLVPEDHLFVMGDNRLNSHDGRCFGAIDDDLVVGRAFFVLWPLGHAGGL